MASSAVCFVGYEAIRDMPPCDSNGALFSLETVDAIIKIRHIYSIIN
jgi:hypothetical protein